MADCDIVIMVRAFGGLGHFLPGGKDSARIVLPRGSKVSDVIKASGIPEGEVWLVSLGGELVGLDREVRDGDEITVFAPVGGG